MRGLSIASRPRVSAVPASWVILTAAVAVMGAAGPVRAADPKEFTSAFVASWNLNHGEYLVDVGQYLEAIEAFDTAIEMADAAEVKDDARLQKASVLAIFLDQPDEAVRVYDDVVARRPGSDAAAIAVFRAGLTLFDSGRYGDASRYFDRYLREFPHGESRSSAELLLQQSRAQAANAPTRPVAPSPPPTRMPAPPAPAPSATAPQAATAAPTAAGRVATAPRAAPTIPAPAAGAPPPTPGTSAPLPSIAEVRVRVFKGQSSVRVESDADLSITPPLGSGRAIELTARNGMVSADGGAGVREVSIRAAQPLALQAGKTVRHYRGWISVRADGNALAIVNHVGLEDYLYGVVTKESGASWPIEALKAQAVASRTYAVYQVQHRRDRSYDMVDDEGSQVYGGVDGETAAAHRAVDETRGVVLAYADRPVLAMFTANTGWYTADPKFVFDQALPYLNAVPDPYSPGEQLGRWTRTHSAEEVRRALGEIGVKLGPIRSIQPQLSCPSGRIIRVAIEDDQGAHAMRTRPTLARALKLPEILLDIRHEGDKFVFAGGGFGHGVGLSQWGAKNMASKGFAVNDILGFYYRGAQLATLKPQ